MAYNDNTFVALIDQNGFIRDMSTGRRGEIIGIDWQKEEEYKRTIAEMQETIDNYYGKLVELKAITIPKSPEQIAQEAAEEQIRIAQEQATQQAEINKMFMESLQSSNQMLLNLQSEIKELKSNGRSGHGNEFSNDQSGCDSASDGKVSKSSKVSASTGAKATS